MCLLEAFEVSELVIVPTSRTYLSLESYDLKAARIKANTDLLE